MENELENNIPVPEPEKNITPAPQSDVDVEKRTRGTRKRGNKKNKDSTVDAQNPNSVEPEEENHVELDEKNGSYDFVASQESISDLEREKEEILASLRAFDRQKRAIYNMNPDDADAQLEGVDSLMRNAENRLAGVEKKIAEFSGAEPLPQVPPPFEPDVTHVPVNETQPELENSDTAIVEKKRGLTPQQEAVIEKVFNDPQFKEKCKNVGITDLFQDAFEKMYGVYRDDLVEQDTIIASLEEKFNEKFTASFRTINNPLISQAIFQLFMGEYDDEYQKKYADNALPSEIKLAESFVITPGNYEQLFHSSEFIEKFKKLSTAADIGVKQIRDLLVNQADPQESANRLSKLKNFITTELRNGLPGTSDALLASLCDLFIAEARQRLNDQEPASEIKAVEPVGEVVAENSPKTVSPIIDTNAPRDVKVSFDSNGNPLSVTVRVPRRDSVPAPVAPAENSRVVSETPVILENGAGAPLVVDRVEGEGMPEKSAESSEVQPEKIAEKTAGVETPTVFDTAKKEVENNEALKEARLKFAEADAWLGKNGFTARDIAKIEDLHKKDSEIPKGSSRVNLLESHRAVPSVPEFSTTVKKYVNSLSTSGVAFVDIRHAKKFFASDDQKNALAQGLKDYFKTRKEYEDGKKQVARGVWEKMGGIELQEDLILKRDGIVDDRDREAATVEEVKVINELRSAIFEAAIVGEMERLNEDKISVVGPAEKGILQQALDGVRNINPTVRRAFATAVATGVISLGVSTAGVGTLGVLAGYAGARYIRSLIAASVGTGVGELQGKLLGSFVNKLHNFSLSEFQKRLLSVEGEADFDKFIDDYARERSDIFKDYLLAKKIVVGSTIITSIALGAITSAELHGLLDVDLGDHPIIHPDQHSTPVSSNLDNHGGRGHQSPPVGDKNLPNTPDSAKTPLPADHGANTPKAGDAPETTPPDPKLPPTASDATGAKPSPAETTPAGPKTSGVVEAGKNLPKTGHVFKGPTLSSELEKIANGAKSPEEVFKGDGVKLNLDEFKNAAVVGKGGSAWGVVHKQLELLAKSGIDPKKLGLNISSDDINDHAKFSHALEMRTRSILEENGFISKSGEVRIASPDTRLGLTAVVDEKGATHFVITKPDVTDRPVFYEYHPTQRLSVPVNHVPPEVSSGHTPPVRSGGVLSPRVNIDTVQTPEELYSQPFGGSHETVDSLDKKSAPVEGSIPKSAVSQSDIDRIANSHEVVPEPRPAGLEKTPPPLPKVDYLVSEKVLRDFLPKEVLSGVTPNEIPKIQNFLEQMGFSDRYIETRWKDLSRISVTEFQKHIDEIMNHKADPKLFSLAIHFDKDLAPKTFSYNPGADIPAEDRLYKIADLIIEKKEVIERNDLLQKRSVAQFIVDEALHPLPKK